MSSFLKWGFRSNLKLRHIDSKDSIELPLKGTDETTKYVELIEQKLPIIDTKTKLWLNPLLFNGTLQTLYYTSSDSSNKFLIYYGRELFTYKDEGICSLDWVISKPNNEQAFKKLHQDTLPEGFPRLHPRSRYLSDEELKERKASGQEGISPILVILHGLGGGSHEPLIRNLAENFQSRTENWDIVVINSRGCCRTKITTGKLFSAFSTDDIKEVLLDLKRRYPDRPLYAVGFSFGAALLANYLGESKDGSEDSLVKTACLVGAPWDMIDSANHLDKSWTGTYLLHPVLSKYLNKIIKNNYKELNLHNPGLFNEANLAKGDKHKKTWEFDDLYTCKTVGYDDALSYYEAASPVKRISSISTPTLIINSTDDPAVGVTLPIVQIEQNPNLVLLETDLGGHLGWVQTSGKFWCVEVVEEYFKMFEELIK